MNAITSKITEQTKLRFAKEVAKYPDGRSRSAVMACLAIVQQEQGHISSQAQREVADYLGVPEIAVHEVTTFYNMYNQQAVGKYKINVCTNLSCLLRGSRETLQHLRHRLDLKLDETSADGLFTLQQAECLGACADAPVLLVNDRNMCSYMSAEKVDQLIDQLLEYEEGLE